MPKTTKGGKPKKSELPRANPVTEFGRCFDVRARPTMLQDSRAIGPAAWTSGSSSAGGSGSRRSAMRLERLPSKGVA